ncbi:hypothetical protein, partial [Paenibacillus qinlingensis]
LVAFITYFIISREMFPFLLYYLLYRLDGPGYFEQLYKYFIFHEELRITEYINLDKLIAELNIAFILPSFITTLSVFMLFLAYKYLKPFTGKKAMLFPVVSLPLSFLLLFLFILHSTQQWGALGKNLAQFDNDYVCIEYNHPNNQYASLAGIRIIQTNNVIVLRSVTDITYTVSSDRIYVKSLLERPNNNLDNSCSNYR